MKIKSFSVVVVFNHNIKLLLFSWSFAEKHSDTTKLTYFIIYWIFDYLGILRLLYCCLTFIIYKNDIINFKRRPRSSIPNWVCQLDNHLDVSLTGLWRNMMILTPQFINLLSKKNFMESCQHQTNDQERLKILSQQAEAEQHESLPANCHSQTWLWLWPSNALEPTPPPPPHPPHKLLTANISAISQHIQLKFCMIAL